MDWTFAGSIRMTDRLTLLETMKLRTLRSAEVASPRPRYYAYRPYETAGVARFKAGKVRLVNVDLIHSHQFFILCLNCKGKARTVTGPVVVN